MRTYVESKAMARTLRESLAALGVEFSHSQCLELVAKQFGFAEWNILASKIRAENNPREQPGAVSLEPPIPTLLVTNRESAAEFYVDFLGFSFDWGNDGAPDLPLYAQVSRGGVQLHLAQASEGGRPSNLLFRDMTGLDALHRELMARKGRFAPSAIAFTPWDSRMFHVTDPFGNELRFWENNPPGVAKS
jgi:catechol 2,3-dioxygenase-like lactoylglutathione lyase family enzyme